MKLKKLSVLIASFGMLLTACGGNPIPAGDGYIDTLPESMNDGVFLQAFNWKYSQVRDNLEAIAEQGFKGVQISPVQIPKSGGAQWYFFYQPVSFTVAEKSPLGTKAELQELCTEAEKHGISIIVDVVANHMASTGKNDENGLPIVDPEVELFEPEIYQNRTQYFHQKTAKELSGSGLVTQYYQYGVLPDLNTGDEYVQSRVLSFLKECIDLGVDGFRFDAAKHIETPEDPQYPSDFWPNTLGVAKEYYHTKTGQDLFAYGEVLGGLEGGRNDLSIYTKYMKVSDDAYIGRINSGFSGDAEIIANSDYAKRTDASNIVLWAESHDTYETEAGAAKINRLAKQWATISTRKDVNAMFLARPDDDKSVGVINSYDFEMNVYGACNRFHNRFIKANEEQFAQGVIYINERYSETDAGAVIINTKTSQGLTKTVKFTHLPDGDYFDQVTNSYVHIQGGEGSITFDKTGVCILTKTNNSNRPSISISSRSCSYLDPLKVTITANNATSAYYQIDGGEKVNFSGSTSYTIVKEGETKLFIHVENGNLVSERTFRYTRITGLIDGKFNVINLNPSYLTDYELWVWAWNTNSTWMQDYTWNEEHQILLMGDVSNYKGFLLAIFKKGDGPQGGTNIWKSPVKQSSDIDPSKTYFDASSF